jgi:hypothetical protein
MNNALWEAIAIYAKGYPQKDDDAIAEAMAQLATAVFVLNTVLPYEDAGKIAGNVMFEAVAMASVVNEAINESQ